MLYILDRGFGRLDEDGHACARHLVAAAEPFRHEAGQENECLVKDLRPDDTWTDGLPWRRKDGSRNCQVQSPFRSQNQAELLYCDKPTAPKASTLSLPDLRILAQIVKRTLSIGVGNEMRDAMSSWASPSR